MPIIITPASGEDFGREIVGTPVNFQFSAVSDLGAIVSMTVKADAESADVVLTDGVDSCSVTGEYSNDLFPGLVIRYVDKGESDLTQTPVEVTSIDDVPDKKEVLSVTPSSVTELLVTYTVTAEDITGDVETATYTYTVEHDHDPYKNFINDYFANRYE
jgi:hypothetical protein